MFFPISGRHHKTYLIYQASKLIPNAPIYWRYNIMRYFFDVHGSKKAAIAKVAIAAYTKSFI